MISVMLPVAIGGFPGNIIEIGVGNNFYCALTIGDAIQCWGINTSGQLGDGSTTQRASPAYVTGLSGTGSTASQSISFGALANKTYGDPSFAVSASASSGLAVTFNSITTGICTVSGTTVTIVAGGACTIAANQSGNSNYSAAPQVTRSFTVVPAAQFITFPALTNKAYGSAPFALTATASSSLAVSYSSLTTTVCTVSGAMVSLVNLGTCTIAANQGGNTSYTPAAQVSQSFSVNQGAQLITGFAPPTPLSWSASGTFALNASGGGSGNPVIFASGSPAVCTVAGSTATIVTIGTCILTANQAGNSLYTAAPQVSANVTISATVPGAPTITAVTPRNASAVFVFSAPGSNGGSSITGYTVSCNPGTILAAAAASPITVSGLANGTNYACSVSASNIAGTGPASSPVSVIPAIAAPQTFTFNWDYDANGHLNQLTYPDGVAVAYNPNALGEPTQVGSYATGISYQPTGAIGGFTYGNGIVHTQTFNTRNLPATRQDAGVMKDVYTYDANGNITGIADQQENISLRNMSYDNLDRLITTNAPNMWGSASYSYDALDNIRVSNVGSNSVTRNYEAATNRLIALQTASGTTNISYDVQGNVSMRGAQGFVFDQGNRLKSATGKADYIYDGLGRRTRISQIDGTTKLQIYSKEGQLLYGVQTGGPNPGNATRYIYLAKREIAEDKSQNGSTSTQYVHVDGLGSPTAHSAQSGTILDRSRYEPYGVNAPYGNSISPTGIGFTGHVNDQDTGLTYMQQRYYDALAGRFLSLDPLLTESEFGGRFNRYVYAINNPYKHIDPDGRDPEIAGPLFFRLTTIEATRRDTTIDQAVAPGAPFREITAPVIVVAASPSAVALTATAAAPPVVGVITSAAEVVSTQRAGIAALTLIGALGKLVNGPVPPGVPRMGMGRHIEIKAEIAKASARPRPAPQGSPPSPPKPEITPPPVPTNP